MKTFTEFKQINEDIAIRRVPIKGTDVNFLFEHGKDGKSIILRKGLTDVFAITPAPESHRSSILISANGKETFYEVNKTDVKKFLLGMVDILDDMFDIK